MVLGLKKQVSQPAEVRKHGCPLQSAPCTHGLGAALDAVLCIVSGPSTILSLIAMQIIKMVSEVGLMGLKRGY